uniref:Fibronectin type-III domain-containing protein n=1 Tax=Clastoptera arizonana TaxID=38151 RepID=A0A1B6CS62_9HEMI
MILKTIFCVLIVVVLAEVCCCMDNVETEEMGVDERQNIFLPCGEEAIESYRVSWVRDGRDDNQTPRRSIFNNGSLFISDITRHDAGIYECQGIEDEIIRSKVKLVVRTPPPPLVNVTVHACTILASIRWEVEDTGGYPIDYFKAQFRLKHTPDDQLADPWHPVVPEHISSSASQIDVYHLEPNSTYIFQVWAVNKLGQGEVFETDATTQHNNEEIELGRHLLEGAETFDTRVWVAAVAIVMGTLVVLALGTCYALYRECHIPLSKSVPQ